MSKASLTTVRRMVYENLGITLQGPQQGYGNIKTNDRYPAAYVDDAIAGADLSVMKTLLKSKQYHFSDVFFEKHDIPTPGTAPISLPVATEYLTVDFYEGTAGSSLQRGVEIPWAMYEMFTEPLEDDTKDLFTFSSGSKKYGGYYSIQDYFLYTIPFSGGNFGGNVGYYKFIDLGHPEILTELKSPKSFEEAIAFLASANLLMKRADNPQQATYYLQQFQAMMGIYMTPSINQQRVIDQ